MKLIILTLVSLFASTVLSAQINIFLDTTGIEYLKANNQIIHSYKGKTDNALFIGGTYFEPGSYIDNKDAKKIGIYVERISISGSLDNFPKSLLAMKNVQVIEIQNFEKMPSNLFKKIARYNILQKLSFNFPKENAEYSIKHINLLKNLKELSLLGHNLKEIPLEIYKIENLEDIDFSLNELNQLSPNLCLLHKLKRINFSHNKFSAMPELLNTDAQCWPNIEIINLSNNKINNIPNWAKQSRRPVIYW